MASWLSFLNNDQKTNGGDEIVYEVVQRMQSSLLYEDKIEAISKLVELSSQQQYQKDFAKNESFQMLVQILNKQRDDLDFTRQVLEIVLNLTHSEKFGDQFLSLIVNNGHMPTILGLLDESDYYIKFHTIKLISLLLKHNAQLVQQSILSEASVSKLIAILDDSEDYLRSEGILLMNILTYYGSQEVKKIIAFEGTFEKLFRIIFEEGGNNGGVTVLECLQIMYNLLLDNESNQKNFLVIEGHQYLQHLLFLRPISNENVDVELTNVTQLTDRKAQIISKALDIVLDLIYGKKSEDIRSTLTHKTQIISAIIVLALSELTQAEITKKALFALGFFTFQFRPAQEALESYNFDKPKSDILESAVVRLCRIVLFDGDEMKRQIAYDCLRKFLYSNKEGQLFIASTVKAPTLVTSSAEEGMLCGITLANAIFSYDKPKQHLSESFHGCQVLSYIIRQNNKCKDVLLEIPYEVNKGKRPSSFFECLVKAIIQAIRSRVNEVLSLGLLQLLLYWIHGSPNSANRFMTNTSNLLFFIELVTSRTAEYATPHTQGLASLLLGLLCVEFEDKTEDSLGGYTKEGLIDVVSKRVGTDRMAVLWNGLLSTNEFQIATNSNASKFFDSIPSEPVPFNVYDASFVTFAQEIHENIVSFFSDPQKFTSSRTLQGPNGTDDEIRPPSPSFFGSSRAVDENVMNKYKDVIKQQETDLQAAKDEILDLKQDLDDTQKILDELVLKISDGEKQKEELEKQKEVAEQNASKLSDEIKGLQLRINQVEQDLTTQQSDFSLREKLADQNLKSVTTQLQQKEQELENLSSAYDHLQQYLDEKEQLVTKFQKQYKEEEAKSKRLVQENESLTIQLQQANEKVNQIQQQEEEKKKKKNEYEEMLKQYRQELNERDTQIAELSNQLNEAKNQTAQQEQQNEQNFLAQIEKLKLLVEEKDQRMLQLKSQIDTQSGELTKLNEEVSKKSKKIEELEQDNDDMMDIVEQLEGKIATLRAQQPIEE